MNYSITIPWPRTSTEGKRRKRPSFRPEPRLANSIPTGTPEGDSGKTKNEFSKKNNSTVRTSSVRKIAVQQGRVQQEKYQYNKSDLSKKNISPVRTSSVRNISVQSGHV